jgi:hypothetical protein
MRSRPCGAQLAADADKLTEDVLERREGAWSRLLSTFRAVHGGVEYLDMRLLAYGGHLFDPDRYPFLEGRAQDTSWRTAAADPVPIHDRTVLHLLEALQVLQIRVPGGGPAEARLLSFRALDVEQIGHVYEGLLDHTARRANEPMLGLRGDESKVREISLAALEEAAFGRPPGVNTETQRTQTDTEGLIRASVFAPDDEETAEGQGARRDAEAGDVGATFMAPEAPPETRNAQRTTHNAGPATRNPQPETRTLFPLLKPIGTVSTEKALGRALASWDPAPGGHPNDARLLSACENDIDLYRRVRPFAGLLRFDSNGYPVVIVPGSVYVTKGGDRRSTGTHYTPRILTEPVVRYALEPLVYDGPADGKPPGEWKLRSPSDILALKICDIAMGSGAFLVQACRYRRRGSSRHGRRPKEGSRFKVQGSKEKFSVQHSEFGVQNFNLQPSTFHLQPSPFPLPRRPQGPSANTSSPSTATSAWPGRVATSPTAACTASTSIPWRSRWPSSPSGWSRSRRTCPSRSWITPSAAVIPCLV